MNGAGWLVHYPQYSEGNYVSFWCPGCECAHTIPFINAPPPAPTTPVLWCYDGNHHSPTISPSLRVMGRDGKSTACHVVITAGVLNYCADSAHALAGKSVPMVAWDARPKK